MKKDETSEIKEEIKTKVLPEIKIDKEENIKKDIKEVDNQKENDQPAKQKKKRIKKKRLKNSMPCNINKRYIMKASHLSKKETAIQCKTKSMKCKQSETCFVHEGRHNLKKIRKWVTTINQEWTTKMDRYLTTEQIQTP